MSSMFAYWGKADPNYPGDPKWHPLAYHSLDVAACGAVLLDRQPAWLEALARTSGLSSEQLRPWLIFLFAIHDPGKFANGFQSLRADLQQMLQGKVTDRPAGERHDTLGYEVAMNYLPTWLDRPELAQRGGQLLSPWLAPINGHHGRPPKNIDNRRALLLRDNFPETVLSDLRAFISEVAKLLMPEGWPLPEPERGMAERYWRTSWLLAGLAVVADWLGSNTRWFAYRRTDLDLGEYWRQVALPQARQAVAESGLIPPAIAAFHNFGALFPRIAEPTPLQAWAAAVALSQGPQLFVLEELTGAGKTEAALTLVARLMAAGCGHGIYIALPTMATADAMFDRVRDGEGWRRFFTGEGAQLALAHSADKLKLKLEEANRRDAAYARNEETTASRNCTAWLSDSRKKALLADFGVGTIDQALLAVLPVRHQSLRLLGLATKVLVVDEVHACDAYMGELLTRLLQFHAAQGGSVILLSATLPQDQRARYLRAFAGGAGLEPRKPESTAYPLATHFSGTRWEEAHVEARQTSARTVAVESVPEANAAFQRLAESVRLNRCAVWIRNTVVDAVEAWHVWNEANPERPATLFHARFALVDRLGIGKNIEHDFGPRSASSERRGRIVIATQVIEQSLDVDFDDMVTDLAPIDLMIQRAGRLQRHKRTAQGERIEGEDADGRGGARLTVLMPEPVATADARWLPAHLKRTGMVYPDHGKLWLTARWLADHHGFTVPEQARNMIETVYGDEGFDQLPEGLRDNADRADGANRANRGVARGNLLDYDTGYNPTSLVWQDEGEAPTRLGEATVRIRLAKRINGVLVPWANTSTGADWQLSELTVPCRLIAQEGGRDAALFDAVRARMADEGRHVVIIALSENGDLWHGNALNARGEEVRVTYSPITGLTTERAADESD